jgi:hypothetical protein
MCLKFFNRLKILDISRIGDTNYDHVRRQKKTYLVGWYRLRRWKHQTLRGDPWEIPNENKWRSLQCEAPKICLLIYKPHEYYSYKYHKTIDIGVINQLNAILGASHCS